MGTIQSVDACSSCEAFMEEHADDVSSAKALCKVEDSVYQDYFKPLPPECQYLSLIQGSVTGQDQACLGYRSWISLIPSAFLSHPTTKENINALLALAQNLNVSVEDLVLVYQNGRPEDSVNDRLARVRTFLIFYQLKLLNQKMSDPTFREAHGWQSPYITEDFKNFVETVLEALRQKGDPSGVGVLNIQGPDQLFDSIGDWLSGDYSEAKRLARISANGVCDFFGDAAHYVTIHELSHWFHFRTNDLKRESQDSHEKLELEATRQAMNALVVFKEGRPLELSRKCVAPQEPVLFGEIERDIQLLPPAWHVVWGKVRDFAKEQLRPTYIQRVYEASLYELQEGHRNPSLEEEAGRLFTGRLFAQHILENMKRLVARAKEESALFKGAECYTNPLNGLEGGAIDEKCHLGLTQALSLAAHNQIPLAILTLDQLFAQYQHEDSTQIDPILGTP